MEPSETNPCNGHRYHEIPFGVYDWDKLTVLVRPEVTPLYNGCTEGCRKFMIQQYKSLIKFARMGIKYYKYQIIPHTMEDDDYLTFGMFMAYTSNGERPEDKFIESHLNHVMRESKFVPKDEVESEDEDSEVNEKPK